MLFESSWPKSKDLSITVRVIFYPMPKKSAEKDRNGSKFEQDIDVLFKLPLAQFTSERNALATRLKREGHRDESEFVKSLAKPSVSAWAVNQLYWNQRKAFDRLLEAGEKFRVAQASTRSTKLADMRGALDARKECLKEFSILASTLLTDAGHNPSPDTVHRITTTLEALSAYASLPDAPTAGRLTADVDPPGFELLSSFVPSGGIGFRKPASKSASIVDKKAQTKQDAVAAARKLKEERQTDIADTKSLLQKARSSLAEARSGAQKLEAALKKANTDTKDAEKRKRDAEDTFKRAKIAAENASQRVRDITIELSEVSEAAETARRQVDRLAKQLEELFKRGKQ